MSERQGVEIDYCPQCRGVWLDRGELDKIIERNAQDQAPIQSAPPQQSAPPPMQPNMQQGYGQHPQGYQQPYYKHKRKKSFLEDLFD